MARWRFLLVAISISIYSAEAAQSAHLGKRESGLRCTTKDDCINFYTTGSASCSSGYERTPFEADGSTPGSYCEKGCTEDEKSQCIGKKCEEYRSTCDLYPASTSCATLLNLCGGPVKTTKEFCTRLNIGQPVIYDDKTGMCDLDKNPGSESEHYLLFNLGPSRALATRLFMTCVPVTDKGAADVESAILNDSSLFGCEITPDFPNGSDDSGDVDDDAGDAGDADDGGQRYKSNDSGKVAQRAEKDGYKRTWKCDVADSSFDRLEKIGEKACKKADHPGKKRPIFEKSRG